MPVPYQEPMASAPAPSVMRGIITSWAKGPTAMAVTGDAAFSTSWANPNTRPWRSKGMTRWSTVCSAASIIGMSASQTAMPTASSTIEERIVNTEHTAQQMRLPRRISRSGDRPRPLRATTRPPAIMTKLRPPHRKPQASTLTSSRP